MNANDYWREGCADQHYDEWDFCDEHQKGFCPHCDGGCLDCRREATLGEPSDDSDDDDHDCMEDTCVCPR